jgi:YegS/Rv2252/BmrU family lipid kinase
MTACVIFNPAAGRKRARKRLQRFLAAHEEQATFRATEYAGHAVELAHRAAEEGFATVAAAGGDGTAHDVANGILQCERDVVFAVVPIGSANDYAHSVARQFGTGSLTDDSSHAVDVGLVTAADGRQKFFIEGIGLGLAGLVTIESRKIGHLQGLALYGLAAWRALNQHATPPSVEMQMDDGPWETHPTLMLSLLLGRREGNFLLAPEALLDDGLFDVAHARNLTKWQAMRMLPRLAWCGPPASHPELWQGRCHSMRVRSSIPLAAHTDGELFCTPEENVNELEIRLLPQRLRVKICEL